MQSSNMVVSLVQAPVVKGQIEQNLQMHLSYNGDQVHSSVKSLS